MRRFNFEQYKSADNAVEFYKDGDEYYPAMLREIRKARKEILIETFILEDDRIGKALLKVLLKAAKRGVLISVTVDSYGSYFLPREYIQKLTAAGIAFQIFEPQPRWINGRPKLLRRLHRKFCIIDNRIGFIGGINLAEDHLTINNEEGKRDFMSRVEGGSVSDMRDLCLSMLPAPTRSKFLKLQFDNSGTLDKTAAKDQLTDVYFIHRDNYHQRSEIEKAYVQLINQASARIFIANAYFFPSNRIVRALKQAVKRGIDVTLIIQGNPDIPISLYLARSLYQSLCRSGVKVYEFRDRPLHAKVAVFDDDWSTIGSSNLDPWSLGLNLEANIFMCSRGHCVQIDAYIDELYQRSEAIDFKTLKRRTFSELLLYTLIYHTLRWWPRIVAWVPGESLKVRQLRAKNPKALTRRSVVAHWQEIIADEDVDFEIRDKLV